MKNYPKKTIGELCNIVKGETGIASAIAGEYPLVVTAKERKTSATYQFDTQAVCIPLVSSSGHGKKSLNHVHYQEGKFALGTILAAVIPKNNHEISANFLHQYLLFYKDTKIVPLMRGAANVSLAVKDIAKIEIPLPPIEEQKDFIIFFNELQKFNADLVREFNNQEKYVSKLKQAILQEAIAGQLTADWRKQNPMQKGNPDTDAASLLAKIKAEKQQLIADGKLKKENPLAEIAIDEIPFFIPESWVWCRGEKIGEYIDPQPSHRTPPEVSDGIPYISMKDIKNGIISLITARKVSYKILEEHKERYQLRNGDFIIGKIGTIGNPVWLHLPQDYTISANLVLIQPNSNIIPKIMFFILASNYCDNHMKEVKSEMSYPVFGIKKMRLMPFPLPPLAEQKAIVEKVNKLMNIIDQLEQQIKHRKQLAEALMQTVLREAFE